MIFTSSASVAISVLILLLDKVCGAAVCAGGHACVEARQCCEHGCCAPPATLAPPAHERAMPGDHHRLLTDQAWTAWPYLLCIVSVGFASMCCAWCMWRSRAKMLTCACSLCVRRTQSDHDSAGSCYPPPQYSRCGSFHHAPPPYSEVTSKPDLYPLVITCGDDNKSGGSYLMVHYFRNYIIRAPGSLSATSTAESLNSSFMCNATNEANTNVPPPYSCAGNYEEWRGMGCTSLLRSLSSLTGERSTSRGPTRSRTVPAAPASGRPHRNHSPDGAFRDTLIRSPIQDSPYDLDLELIDYELGCEGTCRPRLGNSPPIHRSPSNLDDIIYEHDIESLRRMLSSVTPDGAESPPQPTSPTQSRESTLRRPSDDRRYIAKKMSKGRKTSLYMPIPTPHASRPSRISPGPRVSSRSAPATPCGVLVPNLLAFTQRVSTSGRGSRSSRLEEENDPLLGDNDQAPFDHKF